MEMHIPLTDDSDDSLCTCDSGSVMAAEVQMSSFQVVHLQRTTVARDSRRTGRMSMSSQSTVEYYQV